MWPTMVMSSTNLTIMLDLVRQSWVCHMNSTGLRTNPWEAPVFSMMVFDVLLPMHTDYSLCVRRSRIQLQSAVSRHG